jgi:hypothetical protein
MNYSATPTSVSASAKAVGSSRTEPTPQGDEAVSLNPNGKLAVDSETKQLGSGFDTALSEKETRWLIALLRIEVSATPCALGRETLPLVKSILLKLEETLHQRGWEHDKP